MRPISRRWAEASVSRLPKVVGAAQAGLTWLERLVQSLNRHRDIVQQPMIPSPDWGVRVVHDQGEALGPLGLAAPR